ncbi:MAG TPA: hypothetical protein VGL59_16730 [Polyangia bacterium]
MKNWVVAFSLCGTFLASAVVRADEPMVWDAGHVALSVERLFGYSHTSSTVTEGGSSTTSSSDTLSFLGGSLATAYSVPRLGADVFVAPNFSVGLAAAVTYLSISSETGTIIRLAPRVGYAVHAASHLVVWPRIGMSYEHSSYNLSSTGTSDDQTASLTAVTAELPMVIRMLGRASILVDPFAEIGVGGSASSSTGSITGTSSSIDRKANEFGLHFGLLIYL